MTKSEENASVEPEPHDAGAERAPAAERTEAGEHHTLADDVLTVGETIRAILSL